MKTGRGVICFISNDVMAGWPVASDGMRERYLEADVIRVDSLNGDKYKTGKTTPEGDPDPSIFSKARSEFSSGRRSPRWSARPA